MPSPEKGGDPYWVNAIGLWRWPSAEAPCPPMRLPFGVGESNSDHREF
jgi:hypothetical protein